MAAEVLLKSAYEVAREERLRLNRQKLEALGFAASTSPALTAPQSESVVAERKRPKPLEQPVERRERSKRLQGLGPEGLPVLVESETSGGGDHDVDPADDDNDDDDGDARMQFKIARLKQLHVERNTGYKNPTATYEHTWMRVRTMTDKALLNRVKVIERALGKDCVVKMRMFAEVLLLTHKQELAQEAQSALERILGKIGAGDPHASAGVPLVLEDDGDNEETQSSSAEAVVDGARLVPAE